MDQKYFTVTGEPPEIIKLDARIANAGGTSSRQETPCYRFTPRL